MGASLSLCRPPGDLAVPSEVSERSRVSLEAKFMLRPRSSTALTAGKVAGNSNSEMRPQAMLSGFTLQDVELTLRM